MSNYSHDGKPQWNTGAATAPALALPAVVVTTALGTHHYEEGVGLVPPPVDPHASARYDGADPEERLWEDGDNPFAPGFQN